MTAFMVHAFTMLIASTDTWELLSNLKNFRGYKRVENYIKSTYIAAERIKNDRTMSREDVEAFEIDRERRREQLEGFKTVERIISQRDAQANLDIPYDHRKAVSDSLGDMS
jgi:chromodomain-helicase-DNA-binding protein 1